MVLNFYDWVIIISFFLFSLVIGLYAAKYAGRSASEYFLSGRNMPWWLLGVSMVATTFSTDTPNLVTDIVRQNGVAGNWAWWAFLLTGMLTVFIYARLWRRSSVMTDLEFYELRYSGKMASFLRGFRSLYLGAVYNIIVIAMVSLALIKIGAVMLDWPPLQTILIASVITVIYSALGGLRGILLTDFFQFMLAMIGSVGAAVILLQKPEIGGLSSLLSNERVVAKLNLLPDFNNPHEVLILLVIPLAIQWWSVWYPGAEPGGGGYIAQRMLAARSEKEATAATLLFNTAHYALRPWPWILVALASLIVFPDLTSLREAFPDIDPAIIKHDLAYPAMLSLLPNGFLGLVVASLIAAYMSTVSTQLNWGSSYIVHDFYHRFVNPDAGEKQQVLIGRITTFVLMLLSALLALTLQNALQVFQILLQVGAGTGLIYILRWFWWRINAFSEVTAMVVSFAVALYFEFVHPFTGLPVFSGHLKLIIGVALTSFSWILITFLTKPTDFKKLKQFYSLVQPGGPGWRRVVAQMKITDATVIEKSNLPIAIVCMTLGCLAVYCALFAIGYWIYGKPVLTIVLAILAIVSSLWLLKLWNPLHNKEEHP
jgi:SSS family solute:Na+ symporter